MLPFSDYHLGDVRADWVSLVVKVAPVSVDWLREMVFVSIQPNYLPIAKLTVV